MLRIRFQRQGRRKAPFFRVVVAEHSKPVQGRFVEILGYFNPNTKEISLENERISYWLSKGALPTDRVARLCAKNGISECEKYVEGRQMKPSKAEKEAAEAAKKAAEEKIAQAEAEAKAAAEAPVAEVPAEEVKAEEVATEEAPAEEVVTEEKAE